MQIFSSIEGFISKGLPVTLTIGNFDGVHLGHQEILTRMKCSAHPTGITFSNHPSEIVSSKPTLRLITLPHKLQLLHQYGLESLVLLPFTKEFSKQSAKDFLTHVKKYIPFTKVILGHDAVIGFQREGNKELMRTLSQDLDFELEYIEAVTYEDVTISSSTIRSLIQKGAFVEIEKYLGRPYSILGCVEKGAGVGKTVGFNTANLSVEGLCLPPLGVYATIVIHDHKPHAAVTNLGIAPTMRKDEKCLLEAHLLDYQEDLYNEEIEVIFMQYLRSEKTFSSIEALREQIADDVTRTKSLFKYP